MRIPFSFIFVQDGTDRQWTVTCPAIPGLIAVGSTLEEARVKAQDVANEMLTSMKGNGKLAITERDCSFQVETLMVEIP